jgi:cytoskeletal protein CcmA (bactofilin family)
MRFLLARLSVVLTCAALLLSVAAPALAAEVQQGDSVVIGPDQVVNDDVYAFGSNVQVLGTVNGDLFAAGNTVTISGKVNGSVFAAGNTVTITSDVRHAVHAAGNTLTVSGTVAEDATLASGNVNLAPGASVGRDMLIAAGSAGFAAPIGRNVKASVGDLTLAGPIGGDVQAQVTTLRLTDAAHVLGALTYTSERDATIAPGATVGPNIQHLQPAARSEPTSPVAAPAAGLIDWFRGLVGLGVVGLLFVYFLPRFTLKTVDMVRDNFWQSLGAGFALVVGVPIVAILVFVVGLIVGGWPLGLALLALYAMAYAIGCVFAAMFTGRLLVQAFHQRSQHLAWNLVEGLALFGLTGLIPVLGGVVLFVASVFGLGAFALSAMAQYRASQTPVVAITPAPSAVQPELAAA